MARPRKDKSLLMNVPLRLVVTEDQKALIEKALALEKCEFSAWARPILLKAAEAVLERKNRQKDE